LGIILTITGKLLFAELVVLTGIFVAGLIIYLKEKIATQTCLNPYIIILREEKKLVIKKDGWFIEKHILFKARRKTVEAFFVHVDWTGSQDVKITCRDEDGIIVQKNFVTSKVVNWPLWELKFARPLRRGEMRRIVLTYMLPDPAHKASPYYFMSYKNFWRIKEFEWRLSLAEDLKPKAVYFVKGVWPDKALKKAKIPRDLESSEYIVHEWPEQESKDAVYSFEWELKNGFE
jgi:hypothetical protein